MKSETIADIVKLPTQSLLAVAETYAACFEARGMVNAATVIREMRNRIRILEGLTDADEGTVRS